MTVGALIFYSVGLVGTVLRTMLGGVYYFLQDTRILEKMQRENTKKFDGEGVKNYRIYSIILMLYWLCKAFLFF